MDLDPVHPELQAALRSAPPLFLRRWSLPIVRGFLAFLARPRAVAGVAVENVTAGPARVRVYTPDGPLRGGMLWIHGGGLVIGRPEMDDPRCARLAVELGVLVVSARYRLAPDHPFPAGHDDCWAAWRWLVEEAGSRGVPVGRLAVGGESAGGGLAAGLVQRARDEGGPQPAAQLLVYPMLDDRTAARTDLPPRGHDVWTNESNHFGWSAFLGSPPGGDDVPRYAAPARTADLAGLPPTWIGVGTRDLFLDECRDYASRLRQAAVEVALDEVPGAWHGFEAIASAAPVTRQFVEAQLDFLRARLA